MNEFIHNLNTKTKLEKLSDSYYGLISDYDFIDNNNCPRINEESDNRVFAKIKYRQDGNKKYLVKIDNNKKIYNPQASLPENKRSYLLDQYESHKTNFKEVSEKVFSNYLKFLKTSNNSWLLNAEREDF